MFNLVFLGWVWLFGFGYFTGVCFGGLLRLGVCVVAGLFWFALLDDCFVLLMWFACGSDLLVTFRWVCWCTGYCLLILFVSGLGVLFVVCLFACDCWWRLFCLLV